MDNKQFKAMDEFLNTTLFTVTDIMCNKDRYTTVFEILYDYMRQGFEEERVRKHPLNYMLNDGVVRQMEVRHFIIHMMFWYPMMRLNKINKLDGNYILDCYDLSASKIMEYFDDWIIIPYRHVVDNKKMNNIFEKTISLLAMISYDFNTIMGISVDILSFVEIAERNSEFKDILYTKPAPGMQPVEIEAMIAERRKRIIEILSYEEDNNMQPIFRSGQGFNHKQFGELAVMGGLKPDIIGNTIPVPIDTNFITGGLNSIANFFVDKQSGRKSVIANKVSMGPAGYFAAKLNKLTCGTHLEHNIENCGTKRPIALYIDSVKTLSKMEGRYYTKNNYNLGKLKVINPKKDTDLIGTTIWLRSPVTCACNNGKVCKTCYGKLSEINGNRTFNIGSYGSIITSNKIIQDILSTKHLLTTNSKPIKFNDEFFNWFDISGNKIVTCVDESEYKEGYSIIVLEDDLIEIVGFDEGDFNKHVSKFYVRNNKTDEMTLIQDENEVDIYIYSDISDKFETRDEYYELNLSKLEEDVEFGMVVIENNEIIKPLKNIQRLLDKKDHFGCQTVDDLVNVMCKLLIEANISANSVHAELIMKNIVRSSDDIMENPRFDDVCLQDSDYTILRVTEALVNNPSLTIGLASQEFKKQFANPDTYNKCAKSPLDDYFRETLA